MRFARSATTHVFQALLEGAIIASLVVVLIAGTAFAAKGGNSSTGGHKGGGSAGTGTISGPVLVVDKNGNGLANWGDVVSFTVSTTATTQPWVNLQCSQNGVVVAQGWDGYFAGSLTGTSFGLYSPQWTGGAASCTAYLTTPTWVVLAKTSFNVGA